MRRPVWNRFTALQLLVMAQATIAPLGMVGTVSAAVVGLISLESMISVALAAAENPGMIVFGAMFLASPIQWPSGRSQVRVRKYLGIVFFLMALTNGVMFAIESGVAAMLGAPFLVAGTLALALAAPLFLTSSRRLQRLRRWRLLHKATTSSPAPSREAQDTRVDRPPERRRQPSDWCTSHRHLRDRTTSSSDHRCSENQRFRPNWFLDTGSRSRSASRRSCGARVVKSLGMVSPVA